MVKKKTGTGIRAVSSLLHQVDFMDFLDAMTVGVIFLDLDLRVIAMNRFLEALTGYHAAEVVGIHGENIIRSNLPGKGDPVGTALGSDDAVTLEGDIINQSRRKTPIRFTISPLKRITGEKAGVALIMEDISLLKDLDKKIHGVAGQEAIIGHSRKMQEIFELLPVAARTDASVLITGETGTGKDLVAEAIHNTSKRAPYPFIKVNCGALPETLLESELFGHVRGAFTGADKDKPGMFRLAHGGTLFLTEIGDLSLPLQVKILTVLDDKEFFPVGGSKKVSVDVRIIAATHRDLGEFVKKGIFREDLYYRLNVLRLHLTALRVRVDDFRLLLDHFFSEFRSRLHKKIKGFSGSSLKILSAYSYPGNIRELRNIVEYAVNVCPDEIIGPEYLPKSVLVRDAAAPGDELPGGGYGGDARETSAGVTTITVPGQGGWGEMEKGMILNALAKTGGNRSRAAELLGWSRSKLWRKIKFHALG